MALSGIVVECGLAGGRGLTADLPVVLGQSLWTENKTTAGTTTNAAPTDRVDDKSIVFSITAAADSWISIGTAPNASTDPTRRFLPAGLTRDFAVEPGHKVNWAAA